MLRLDLQVRFDEHQQVALELQMVRQSVFSGIHQHYRFTNLTRLHGCTQWRSTKSWKGRKIDQAPRVLITVEMTPL